LNVAGADRLVPLGGKARHAFADGDHGHDLDHLRRYARMRFEHEDAVLEEVDRAGIGGETE
jgi:hypothetical protein